MDLLIAYAMQSWHQREDGLCAGLEFLERENAVAALWSTRMPGVLNAPDLHNTHAPRLGEGGEEEGEGV